MAKATTTKTISVPFTKKQFFALMKAVYLGNWMANAVRTNDIVREYEEIEHYIFSLAPQFGYDKYMDHDVEDGDAYYPTGEFEETTDVGEQHDNYNDEIFWQELADCLAERDFHEIYSEEEIGDMSDEERFTKFYECVDAVNLELENHGIERLRITSSIIR